MTQPKQLEEMFAKYGSAGFKWIRGADIIVGQWVRMKCMFGCSEYGKVACCPPHVPEVDECRRFFDEYESVVVFHYQKSVEKPEDRHGWSRQVNRELIKLEREVFIAGYRKAFMMFLDSCGFCEECTGDRQTCKLPHLARPSPESMAVDVFATVQPLGFPIEVLSDYNQPMNRYAFLLIE